MIYSEVDFSSCVIHVCTKQYVGSDESVLSVMKGKRKSGIISKDKYRLEAKKMYSVKDRGTVVPMHAMKTWES